MAGGTTTFDPGTGSFGVFVDSKSFGRKSFTQDGLNTNIPHAALVRTGEGRRDPWWMLTFDGTAWHEEVLGYGTHGDFVVAAGPAR